MNYYTYRITNIESRKHYYGSRQCSIIPKDDLGIIYFSSSSNKQFIEDQMLNKQNYRYKIIYIFDNRKSATNMEIKLHNKFDIGVNENFYNKVKQTSTSFMPNAYTLAKTRNTHLNNIDIHGRNGYQQLADSVNQEIKGLKISNTKQKNKQGNNGVSSLSINIYNEKDEIMFSCYGNFQEICDKNELPFSTFRRSYQNKGRKLYSTKIGLSIAIKENNQHLKGWYAIKEVNV